MGWWGPTGAAVVNEWENLSQIGIFGQVQWRIGEIVFSKSALTSSQGQILWKLCHGKADCAFGPCNAHECRTKNMLGVLERRQVRVPFSRKRRMGSRDVVAWGIVTVLVLAYKDKRIVKAVSTKHDTSVSTIPSEENEVWMTGTDWEMNVNFKCKQPSGVELLEQMIAI